MNKIRLGSTRSELNGTLFALGMMMIFVAMVMLFIIAAGPKTNQSGIVMIVMVISVVVVVLGIIVIYYSFKLFSTSLYLKNDKCSIVDKKVHCMGKCNNCVIAKTYLEMINKGDGNQSDWDD